MQGSSAWEATMSSPSPEIPPFYVTWRFIIAFTTASYLFLSWRTRFQFTCPFCLTFVHPSSKCSSSFMFHHQYPVSISFVRTSAICLPQFMFINFIYRNIWQIFECTECRLLYFEKKRACVKMSRGKNGKNIRWNRISVNHRTLTKSRSTETNGA